MKPFQVSILALLLSFLSLVSLYKSWFIFNSYVYFIVSLIILLFYLVVRRKEGVSKKSDRIVILSSSLFLVSLVSSWVYHNWKLTNLLNSETMMKISLIILFILALYGNFVFIRAEDSYKRKRGNQRIKQSPKEGFIEHFKRKLEQKEEKDTDVVLILGESFDNEDY